MDKEAQRIKIAEACGLDTSLCPIHLSRACCGRNIPDYLNDLNAMHKSLRSQSTQFNHDFADELWKLATERGVYVHQLNAKDWADCFITVLQSHA